MASPAATTADGKKPAERKLLGAVQEKARQTRLISTPEGVQVSVALADRGERAGAVILDLIFIGLALTGVILALGGLRLSGLMTMDWVIALGYLMFFLIQNFYFLFFELRWQGRTPGKKIMNLRVIDRRGGTLSADAVFARNLIREVELFIPMLLLLSGAGSGLGAWGTLFQWLWIGVFLFFPFFNRDRMRVGDLIAGTWVVVSPKAALLSDLSEEDRYSPQTSPEAKQRGRLQTVPDAESQTGPQAAPQTVVQTAAQTAAQAPPEEPSKLRFTFTDKQLDTYGIFELQTLEDVLRRSGPEAYAVRAAVANRIRQKIGHASGAAPDGSLTPGQVAPFLDQFYKALRQRLEARMLLGDRKESKYD
ncbi:RDD family protein [Hwanghaeella grinnelliae]|uniref:RDD family protein n=1 Tax=Hwanghaeella grinnelliae TaxID=2500179 RepID=A0A437QVW0_9PROT|nr:RDD family protein [Hwanghaeella grinnelliae]RVU38670.1 RDD family protein [Hwanghaeella grinnelliae]